ncbi:ubiquitin ligase [Fusarium mexicanum]|uniref:Ubiquitin ligase n=1 Tax=Fusarium mexicanum TaxID=751941 RepID=A0A8H5J2H1_9HYPO|nr:ubiquitin ligase [Fusarium mexicanum]
MASIDPRIRRIAKEIADCQTSGVDLIPCNQDDFSRVEASLPIPPDTPYFGGTYIINVLISDNYPFVPLSMRFNQKIYHPNVHHETGEIATGALGSWDPTHTIKITLDTVVNLLRYPNPNFPVNEEANTLFLSNNPAFRERAQDWAVKYAGAPAVEIDSASYGGYNRNLIKPFIDAGYDRDAVVEAFKYYGIDRNNGQDYTLEEAYQGDILARLSDAE